MTADPNSNSKWSRHYTNLDKTASKLDRLLGDFNWQPIGEYLAEVDEGD